MLKQDMIDKLNEQINLEFYSSNLYLQMSAWCDNNGYEGAAKFLKEHATEEREHMQRLFDYLTDTDALAQIGTIAAPPIEYASLVELFNLTLDHEKLISKKINELVDFALTSKDYPTFNFLQWYVAEQHEEEKLFKNILDRLTIATQNTGGGVLVFDQELSGKTGSTT